MFGASRESYVSSVMENVTNASGVVQVWPALSSTQRYHITDFSICSTSPGASLVKLLDATKTLLTQSAGSTFSIQSDQVLNTPVRAAPASPISIQVMSGSANIFANISGFIGA